MEPIFCSKGQDDEDDELVAWIRSGSTNWRNSVQSSSSGAPKAVMCTELAIPPHEVKQRREQHEDEMAIRIRWCLEHNLLPAHEHVHLAPGDDSRFMVSVSVTGAPSSNFLRF